MKLTDKQINVIQDVINESHIEIRTLGEDLLDHLCCAVELKMADSKKFETALQESLQELAPNGLHAIQLETVYLLNFNHNVNMKKVMYFIGLVTAVSMSLGLTFRIMRWPGGVELINYGFYGFVFFFVPMVALNYFKSNLQTTLPDKLRIITGLFSGVMAGLGIAFKFSHLQGADQLVLSGALCFSFLFLPLFFFNMYKKAIA